MNGKAKCPECGRMVGWRPKRGFARHYIKGVKFWCLGVGNGVRVALADRKYKVPAR